MKKLIAAISVFMAVASMASALTLTKSSANSYNGIFINESGLAYSTTYALDLAAYDASRVSAQVFYSSASFAAGTFTDGTQSTGNLTMVSTVSLAGQTVTIGGITLTAAASTTTANTTFQVLNSLANTAANLATCINTNPYTSAMMTAQAVGAVVYATSTAVSSNYDLASSSIKITVSGANMTGGTGAYYSKSASTIQIASPGFQSGLPVLSSQGAAIGGLTDQTTYYVIPVDANTIQLATTPARAIAGQNLKITTQRAQLTANTYTLTPLPTGANNASAKWQYSNDGVTYWDIASIDTILVTSGTASTASDYWDFGAVDYRYLRFNVTGPAQGAIALKAVMTTKR